METRHIVPHFLKLTNAHGTGETIYFNAHHITAFRLSMDKNSTTVVTTDCTEDDVFRVLETPEEIAKLLQMRQGYVDKVITESDLS